VLFRRGKGGPAKGRRIRKRRLFALLMVLWLLATAAFFFGLISGIATGIPNLDPSRVQAGEVNGYIYADDGKTILAVLRGSEARVLVEWPEISPWIKHAIVDVEDRRFYEHRGVDLRGILRAVWADVRQKGVVEGG
jgi:penicillin-binding protein 1A